MLNYTCFSLLFRALSLFSRLKLCWLYAYFGYFSCVGYLGSICNKRDEFGLKLGQNRSLNEQFPRAPRPKHGGATRRMKINIFDQLEISTPQTRWVLDQLEDVEFWNTKISFFSTQPQHAPWLAHAWAWFEQLLKAHTRVILGRDKFLEGFW